MGHCARWIQISPQWSRQNVCWRSSDQHTSARTRGSQRSNHQRDELATGQTGRANRSDWLGAENPAKPRTSSSGGTPSELEDPGLSWSWQATQDALECRKDEQRTTQRLKKLGFEEKVKVNWFFIRSGRRTSIGRGLYIYRLRRTYPFQIGLQTDSTNQI